MFRFSQRLRSIFQDMPENVLGELDHYDLEIEDALTSGGWSTASSWRPRMASLDYSTATFVDVDYGNEAHASQPTIIRGIVRTQGLEVDAQALILFGKDATDSPVNGMSDTDGLIYLSLPYPAADQLPVNPGSNGPDFANAYANYDAGSGLFPMASPLGDAQWTEYDTTIGYTPGLLFRASPSTAIVEPFPDDTPPVDLASWANAITYDPTQPNGGRTLWAFRGNPFYTGGAAWPYPYVAWGDIGSGGLVSWRARYFTTP